MNASHAGDFASRRGAFRGGAMDALGPPAIVLGACYLGFGSLVRENDFNLWLGLASTLSAWALPGQVALVELYAAGASVLVIGLAVLFTNARLMPMVITLMPLFRHPATPRWQYYVAAHFIAVTGWLAALRRCPGLPIDQRMPYFAGFALLLWSVSVVATMVGFTISTVVPPPVALGLVFVNPIYFMLALIMDLTHRTRLLAIAFGVVLGPLLHLVTADWGLLITGLGAGTVGYLAGRDKGGSHG